MEGSLARKLSLVLLIVLATAAMALAQQPAAQQPAVASQQPAAQQPPDSKPSSPPVAAEPASKPASKVAPSYKIGPGDVLAVSVWKEPELSQKVPVRPDGMITLPLVGDLKASGTTTEELQSSLEQKLKAFVSSPAVTVTVEEVRSHIFNVLGQVQKPGSYVLSGRVTVLDAVAQAGGFRDFAKTKKIYVMRTMEDGSVKRLPFNYNEVIKGEKSEQNIELESHDSVVVP
jgi:polysaccharide biosynthesis/export protein